MDKLDLSDEQRFQYCSDMIRVGSKSFAMAANLFGSEAKQGAFFLYAWCRYCDDQIDQSFLGHREEGISENRDLQRGLELLESLKKYTESAFLGKSPAHPVFQAFQEVVRKFSIPSYYAMELLEGMKMDLLRESYPDLSSLELYCYRVASTVGLMMSHVMGVSDFRAMRHAADLGVAMQLTNISRDVLEDAEMGRVYLPMEWMKAEGLSRGDFQEILDPQFREAVFKVAQRVLAAAQTKYLSGMKGLKFLPFRSAIAVAAAAQVYSEIGSAVQKGGPQGLAFRAVVPKWKKLLCVVKGAAIAFSTLPGRLIRPWSPVVISEVWRHT